MLILQGPMEALVGVVWGVVWGSLMVVLPPGPNPSVLLRLLLLLGTQKNLLAETLNYILSLKLFKKLLKKSTLSKIAFIDVLFIARNFSIIFSIFTYSRSWSVKIAHGDNL